MAQEKGQKSLTGAPVLKCSGEGLLCRFICAIELYRAYNCRAPVN